MTIIKRIVQSLIYVINKNTIMDSSIVACLKATFVATPLCVGLLTYNYATEEFCRSLFLYAMSLTFDMGLKVSKSISSKESGLILHIFQLLMFFTAILLSVFGLVGFLNNNILQTFILKYNWVRKFVYLFISFQSIWYFAEFLLLSISEILLKVTSKTAIRISQPDDNVLNL